MNHQILVLRSHANSHIAHTITIGDKITERGSKRTNHPVIIQDINLINPLLINLVLAISNKTLSTTSATPIVAVNRLTVALIFLPDTHPISYDRNRRILGEPSIITSSIVSFPTLITKRYSTCETETAKQARRRNSFHTRKEEDHIRNPDSTSMNPPQHTGTVGFHTNNSSSPIHIPD